MSVCMCLCVRECVSLYVCLSDGLIFIWIISCLFHRVFAVFNLCMWEDGHEAGGFFWFYWRKDGFKTPESTFFTRNKHYAMYPVCEFLAQWNLTLTAAIYAKKNCTQRVSSNMRIMSYFELLSMCIYCVSIQSRVNEN